MASLKRWLERRRTPWRAPHLDAYVKFRKENGQARLTSYQDLPKAPVVLDFGGFKGEWTQTVLSQAPDATVHVFEPHPGFADEIRARFKDNPRVHVHAFALGAKDGTMSLSDEGDASSAVADHGRSFDVTIRNAGHFFAEQDLTRVDLAKMNIEGGEYELLPALIDAGLLPKIDRLQVQFHLFSPEFADKRDKVRAQLAISHDCAWDYPFVWEEWRRTV